MSTKKEIEQNLALIDQLIKISKNYSKKLSELSQLSLDFSKVFLQMSNSSGAESIKLGLVAASDLHKEIGKNQEILSDALNKEFEAPLQRNVAAHVKKVQENESAYEKKMKGIQDDIGKAEKKMLAGRKKDMVQFNQALKDMQDQALKLEALKEEHNAKVSDAELKNFMFLIQKAAGVVKSEYEHYSNITNLARSSTEEIITIAFAPPGKTLDESERKHVVDTFLGGLATSGTTTTTLERNPSLAKSIPLKDAAKSLNARTSISQRPATPPEAETKNESVQKIQESVSKLAVEFDEDSSNLVSPISTTSVASPVSASRSSPVASASSSSTTPQARRPTKITNDFVTAIHDFTARTDRELSFAKNDLLMVRQRQDNWLYAAQFDKDTKTIIGKPGWVPVSYTTKVSLD